MAESTGASSTGTTHSDSEQVEREKDLSQS